MKLSKKNLQRLEQENQQQQAQERKNRNSELVKAQQNQNQQLSEYSQDFQNNLSNSPIKNAYNQTYLNNKTLKYISNQAPIEITPGEIIFKDIQVNQTYEITVFVRNLTKTARRIRVFQPTTSKFRADYQMQGAIAAGLSMKVIVTFETNVLDDFSDIMKIVSDDNFEQDIPLYAYAPNSQLIFEPFINLGFIKLGKTKQDVINFKNEGKKQAKVELVSNDSGELKLTPNFFTIQPNEEYKIGIEYTPQDAGIFRGLIEIKSDGQILQKTIDINATSVEFTRFVIDENGSQANQFDFQNFYFGQSKKIQGYLVNNTPKKYRFNIRFRYGLLYSLNDIVSLQTPQEIGKELTEKIMSSEPSEGIIDSYSQIPITFSCHANVTHDNQIQARNYAISNEFDIGEIKDYPYSAIVEFEGDKNDPTILHVIGRGMAPQVKFSHQILEFGECNVNDHCELNFTIENRNKDVPIDISIPRVPYFHATPNKVVIEPLSVVNFVVSFRPKQIGKFNTLMNICLVNENYQIPIKLLGLSREINNKLKTKRGPEVLPIDFEQEKVFVDEKNLYKNKMLENSTKGQNPKWIDQTDDDFKRSFENRKKYDQFLKDQRDKRAKEQNQQKIAAKYQQMTEILKNLGINSEKLTQIENDDGPALPPKDNEFEVGMINTKLEAPQLKLPEAKDKLYVTKPIADYEPYNAEDDIRKFDPNPNYVPKKNAWPEIYQNHVQQRDVNKKLGGEELQKIFAGPVDIDFGNVYKKSVITKTFHIRNDLRTHISVRLVVDGEELSETIQKPQIIPPSQYAYFPITLCTNNLGPFRQNVKYIINEKHHFELQVSAVIQLVKLELSKTSTKMQFSEEKNDMTIQEIIRISNNGNAAGQFKWVGEKGIFKVVPQEGEVESGGHLDCQLTYYPSAVPGENKNPNLNGQGQQQQGGGSSTRTEEEKLILKVLDGQDLALKCQGVTQEPKTYLKSGNLDYKQICICQPEVRILQIKNGSRIPAIFQVDEESLPECTEVIPSKGRIGGDDIKDLHVKFFCKEEKNITGNILIKIRGGKTIKVPLNAEVIIPDIQVLEEEFDFGNIMTLGNVAQQKLTMVNNSPISAELVLDLRTFDENPDAQIGIDCLDVVVDSQLDESILHSVHPEHEENEDNQQNENNQFTSLNDQHDDFEGDPMHDDTSESEDENMDIKKTRLFKFWIKPDQTLYFNLRISPKEEKQYKFLVPFTLARYGYLQTMERQIICNGLQPKFFIAPQPCEFKRKIIMSNKLVPSKQEISIHNPDRKPINWRLDTSSLQNENKIFSLSPTEGTVQPGQQQRIEALFNPYLPGVYENNIPLYIDDPDLQLNTAYMDIQLKGEGALPRLLFDRKEIILPVVPLNVQAKCVFRILNDGYENLNLRYDIIQDNNNSKINLQLNFLDGNTLGITRDKIRIEAVFSNPKPLSFTTRIEFKDDLDNIYSVYISGTTDNCLFTNFSYMQRCQGEFKIEIDEEKKGAISLIEDDYDDDSVGGASEYTRSRKVRGPRSVVSNRTLSSNASVKSVRTALGYSPIPGQFLEQNVEFICRWLNLNILNSNIQNFPQSIIESNGAQIFELVSYVTGRQNLPYRQTIENNLKRVEKVERLYKQYDEFIRALKIEGAMLNHIRPEFLLSYNDFQTYMKGLSQSVLNKMTPNAQKIPSNRFQYLSIDAWTNIFYQILKIYYLARINQKTFKSIKGIPPEKSNIPVYAENSNLISVSEALVLNWLEIHYELTHPYSNRRISNLDDEFRDGSIISSVILSYVGKNQDLQSLKSSCSTENDFQFNAQKIAKAITKIGLASHLQPKDFLKPSMKEMLLLNLQLLFSLPHYIPQKETIVFSCILGEEVVKYVELINPSNKQISYYVNLEAHSDFSLEGSDTLIIEPKSTFKVRIKFTSRISDSVTGRITFTNKKDSNISAAALVFNLKSEITGRRSQSSVTCEGRLYETSELQLPVQNLFTSAEYADFNIQIIPIKYKKDDDKKKQSMTRRKKKEENQEIFPCFFCRDTIRIKKGATQMLVLNFIPLTLENQKCYIIFKDPNVGEMQYEVEGKVILPPFTDMFKFPKGNTPIYVDEQQTVDIQLSHVNEQMVRARRNIENLMFEKHREKIRKDRSLAQQPMEKLNFPGGIQEQVNYEIELQPSTNYISIPSQFVVQNQSKKEKQNTQLQKLKAENKLNQPNQQKKSTLDISMDKKSDAGQSVISENQQQQSQNLNKLPLTLLFKNPVRDLKLQIIMRNKEKTDIRIYRLEITALPKPVKAILEFRVPSRNITTQEIPIVNNSDKNWNIKVNLYGDNSKNANLFSCPHNMSKEFIVYKNSTGNFPLTFTPKWLCQAEAKLELTNQQTNDKFEYTLRGYGEEPVAEDHIVINCKARETTVQEIELKNPYSDKEITYKVETDLINASGPTSLTIKPNKKGKYQLKVSPVLSGQYTGSITFFENENKYIWYTVLLNTESPKASRVIDLSTQIRQCVVFEIELTNPLQQDTTFDAIINGQDLHGDQTFTLPPKSSGVYELTYSPLKVGKASGTIAFVNEILGEIWYDLNLYSEDSPPQRLPVLRTELGKVDQHVVHLQNPSEKEVRINTKVINQTNFDVIPDKIVLKPKETLPVQIRYMPSNLDVTESGEVQFNSQEIGNWKFLVFGIGISPTPFEPRIVSVGLNKDYSSTIHFKNPFKEPIQVSISMEAEGQNAEVFKLLTKQKNTNTNTETKKIQVPGMNVVQIPFSFVPREINCYDCVVVVQMNEKIEWRYPIRGVVESISNNVSFHFKTQCRKKLEDTMRIQLQGVLQQQGSDDKFNHELVVPEEYNNLVKKFFSIVRENPDSGDFTDPLDFSVKFAPLKPFKTTLDFNIIRKAGGRWSYKILIEATEPKEDDLIVISSPLHKTTSVSFKLTNPERYYAPYVAQFTPDSDPEFTVMPKSGDLEPYQREGTTFVISFTPIQYGKTRKGKLIIQTEDMYWSYLVKGTLPKYNPPQIIESNIDNKLNPQISIQLGAQQSLSRNYVIDNMKSQKNYQSKSIQNRYKKDISPESRYLQQQSQYDNNKSIQSYSINQSKKR